MTSAGKAGRGPLGGGASCPAHTAPPTGLESTGPDKLGTHPGVSHHVTQDHMAIVQGPGEGLAGGDALSHLCWQRRRARVETPSPTGVSLTFSKRWTGTHGGPGTRLCDLGGE